MASLSSLPHPTATPFPTLRPPLSPLYMDSPAVALFAVHDYDTEHRLLGYGVLLAYFCHGDTALG